MDATVLLFLLYSRFLHFPYNEDFLILLRMKVLRKELLETFNYLRQLLAKTHHSQLDKLIEIKEIPISATIIKASVPAWADLNGH